MKVPFFGYGYYRNLKDSKIHVDLFSDKHIKDQVFLYYSIIEKCTPIQFINKCYEFDNKLNWCTDIKNIFIRKFLDMINHYKYLIDII